MSPDDPLARGAAQPLPEIGEGCVRRFDPQALSDEHGTDFAQARSLWLTLQADAVKSLDPARPPECVSLSKSE